jgi:ubiquinol-cytochrome c reductase cytochrome b subunit
VPITVPLQPRRPQPGLLGWLDDRTGYRLILSRFLDRPVRGGASFAYTFGWMLLFLLINQGLTGVLLAAFYAPSATTAWASVAYIQDQVWLGWFIRGLHAAGASSMMVLLLCHLMQTAVYGAYRSPREVNWLTGVLLLFLVMSFALTGYLLPWDQKGYWATQVVTTILGSIPLIGRPLQTLIQGGPSYGNLTLTHFFSLHVFVLPGLVFLITLFHTRLFHRHGVTPRWGRSDEELAKKSEPLWPRQLTYDLGASVALLGLLMAWVISRHGAELSAPADPSSAYDARPEWYFLPLYQLLRILPASLETAGALLVPLVAFCIVSALPFLDKAKEADPRLRKGPIALLALGILLLLTLGTVSKIEDAGNQDFQHHRDAAEKEATYARELAKKGVLPEGGVAVYQNDPLVQGKELYAEHCAGCHPLGSMRPAPADQKGPELTQFGSRAWLDGFLRNPDDPRYFGKTKIHDMKPVKLPAAEMKALVEYTLSLSGDPKADPALAAAGQKVFDQNHCVNCHERDGKTESEGPNLLGHGTAAWVRGVLVEPGSALNFSDDSDMPSFKRKLSAEELDRVAEFVAAQRDR